MYLTISPDIFLEEITRHHDPLFWERLNYFNLNGFQIYWESKFEVDLGSPFACYFHVPKHFCIIADVAVMHGLHFHWIFIFSRRHYVILQSNMKSRHAFTSTRTTLAFTMEHCNVSAQSYFNLQ